MLYVTVWAMLLCNWQVRALLTPASPQTHSCVTMIIQGLWCRQATENAQLLCHLWDNHCTWELSWIYMSLCGAWFCYWSHFVLKPALEWTDDDPAGCFHLSCHGTHQRSPLFLTGPTDQPACPQHLSPELMSQKSACWTLGMFSKVTHNKFGLFYISNYYAFYKLLMS